MTHEGFRNSSSMVASVSLYANLDSLINGLPGGVKLLLATLFAALGNFLVEYLRERAADRRKRREAIEARLAGERAGSLPPPPVAEQ